MAIMIMVVAVVREINARFIDNSAVAICIVGVP